MRTLRRAFGDRWFLFGSALTIALAVGANLVVFTIINAVWLRPPAIHDPDRVVVFRRHGPLAALSGGSLDRWDARTIAQFRTTGAFEAVAGQVAATAPLAVPLTRVTLGAAADAPLAAVTSDYFRLLGLPVAGRDFTPEDDRIGASPVAIISDGLWRRSFGERSDVIGASFRAGSESVRVIGVAPPGFHGAIRGEAIDIWVSPQALLRLSGSDAPANASPRMIVLCRLNQGLSAFAARAALAPLGRGLENQVEVVPVSRLFGSGDLPVSVIEPERIVTLAVVAALLVLVCGCATLMCLALVHYERRGRELAICLALGARRGTLLRQLAAELVPLAILGGTGALLVSEAVTTFLPSFSLPGGVDLGRLDLSFDWRVVGAAFVACVASLMAAVAVPLRRFTRPAAAGNLVAFGTTPPRSAVRGGAAVLMTHAALTVVVLVGAALLVEAASYGLHNAGFDLDRTLFITARISRPAGSPALPDEAEGERLWSATRDLMDQLSGLPGIDVVALGPAPLGSETDRFIQEGTDIDTDTGGFHLPLAYLPVGRRYLAAIGAPVLLGEGEPAQGPVVSASLASALWPGESPVGRPLVLDQFNYRGTVSGMVDVSFGSLRYQRPHVVFDMGLESHMPANLTSTYRIQLVVNGHEPDRLRTQIVDHLRRAHPGANQITLRSGRDVVDADLGREQLGAWLFSGFGLVGLLLGAGAVVGLVAHQVTSRRAEFGVMLALGSGQGRVMRKAVAIGLRPTLVGAAIGLMVATFSARTIEAFLLGASGVSIGTYATVFGIFAVCAGLAAASAAWPLRRLSPREALARIAD